MSSNVSTFESIFRAAVCDPSDTSKINALLNMPENEKPVFFQNKDASFIRNSVANLRHSIQQICGEDLISLTTNNNNRLGNDIEDLTSLNSFEVKLGGMTDANLGLGIMEWSLDLSGDIRNIMGTMKDRQKMFLEGKPHADILANRDKSKKDMEVLFLSKMAVGSLAPKKLAHTAIAISHGVTTEPDIKEMYISQQKAPQNVSLMVMQANGSFVKSEKAFPYDEDFIVEKLGVGVQGGGAQIHLRGKKSNQSIEFRQHFKNSHTDSSTGIKIPSEFWVKTPCFNVWIGK